MNSRHLNNLKEIEDFLIDTGIPYKIDDNDIRIFYLNNGKLELRYVDSENHKMDYSKRFGIKGINHDYFINITKLNKEKGIRTIWIKDFEIEQKSDIIYTNGNKIKDYIRKCNVIKSYII